MASILLTRSFPASLQNNKTLKLKMFARNNFQCVSKHFSQISCHPEIPTKISDSSIAKSAQGLAASKFGLDNMSNHEAQSTYERMKITDAIPHFDYEEKDCQISCNQDTHTKNNDSSKPISDASTIESNVSNHGKQSRIYYSIIDLIPHFYKEERLITLPGYFSHHKFIKKQEIKHIRKRFKKYATSYAYILPDESVSRLLKDKGIADYQMAKQYYCSIDDATKKMVVTSVNCLNPELHNQKFDNYSLVQHITIEPKTYSSKIPNVKPSCIRCVEPIERGVKILDSFRTMAHRPIYVSKNSKGKYVQIKKKEGAMARINSKEYSHCKDKDIKANYMTVTSLSDSKELKKLENLGFLQIYSAEKKALIFIDDILAKLKTLTESDGGDFSVRAFSDLEKDNSLKKVHSGHQLKYQKASNANTFTLFEHLKEEKPSSPDLVCQKFHFESLEEQNVIYHVWKIIETTDKELKQFEEKALLQRVDQNHQAITSPDDVFHYMLDNYYYKLPSGMVIADYHVKIQQFNLLSILSRYYSTTVSTNSKCPSIKSPMEKQGNYDNLSETSNPNDHQSAIIKPPSETTDEKTEHKEDYISIPDVSESSLKTVKPVGDQMKTLSDFKMSYQKTIYVTMNDEGKYVWNKEANAMAMISYNEYTNNKNKDIKAISMKVSAIKGAKKLEKLENMEFLQVYSAKKQALITITQILTKMKTLEESDDGDFSLMDFSDIKDNKSLKKMLPGGRKRKYQKTLDGTYKETTSSHPELVCQKFQFKEKNNPNIKYYVFLILETTDLDLEPFVGKAFSQKVDQNHQTITTSDGVFNYMLKEHWMNYVSK